MTTIVTRSGKGSSLSWSEVDTNFNNLNTDKIETSALGVTVQEFSANLDTFSTVAPTAAGLALLDDADATAQRNTLGLNNVDNTSDATKNAASVTLTNKTITTPVINTNINFSGTSGTIQVGGVDKLVIGTTTVTPSTGVTMVGNGPAYTATFASVGASNGTLLLQPTEEFDTSNAYSAGRFTPLIAGYYQISASLQVSATTCAYVALQIKKNTTAMATTVGAGYATSFGSASVSTLVYLNGVTDYIEVFQDISTTGAVTIISCRTSAFLARSA